MTTAIASANAGVLIAGTERALGSGTDGLRKAWNDRRAYRATVAELDALTDRQLADVGIARGAIRTHVRMAIYGN